MEFEILILQRAQIELEQAYEYYAKISQSVLNSFDNQLEEAYRSLETNPFFEVKYKNMRTLPLKSYPYMLFFIVSESEKLVRIYSIFNTYQNPEKYP